MTPAEFRAAFKPAPGVKYGWVAQYARDEHARLLAAFKALDDKAAAIGNYLGAGVGLAALGAVNGAAAGHLSLWVVVAAVPSVWYALRALVASVQARKTVQLSMPAGVIDAVRVAEYFGEEGEAAFVGCWAEASAECQGVILEKGRRVDEVTDLFVRAVALLAIPLAAVLIVKFAGLT